MIELIDDRVRMLAAVGHDLRTPITRMRLRCEFVGDDIGEQMRRDLDQMKSMVDAALAFMRDGHSEEPPTTIDLASNIQTICDQFVDLGNDVTYEGLDHLSIWARPNALDRAISNLIDNAVRYGGRTVVRLASAPRTVMISIEDDGPGIPDAEKEAMLEPFVRGDAARSMNDAAGFGLGLSIARSIVKKHGGTLVLQDRHPKGLTLVVTLPNEEAGG